jgi:hypothetical protein
VLGDDLVDAMADAFLVASTEAGPPEPRSWGAVELSEDELKERRGGSRWA